MIIEIAENPGVYRLLSETVSADEILEAAREIMDSRFAKGACFNNPDVGRHYFKHKLGVSLTKCLRWFLDSQHRMVAYEELFRGSLTAAQVHVREIAKRALFHNAAALNSRAQPPERVLYS